MESQLEEMKDRLDSSQRAWSAMRRELEQQKSQRVTEAETERLLTAVELQSKSFKECLARMISDGCVTVEPFEETITQRIHDVIVSLQQKSTVSISSISYQ